MLNLIWYQEAGSKKAGSENYVGFCHFLCMIFAIFSDFLSFLVIYGIFGDFLVLAL